MQLLKRVPEKILKMFSINFKLIITITLLGSIDNIMAKRLMFTNGCCTYNREVFSNVTLQIPNGTINFDIVLVKPLLNGLKGHLSFKFRTSKTQTYQNVFEFDHDFCSVLKENKNTITRRWFLSILKSSNYSTTCPIQPAYYYMYGWKVEGNLVLSFLAIGNYRIEGTFYYGKFRKDYDKPLLRCSVEANLVE